MPGISLTESDVERAALEWFAELGYRILNGQEIAPGAEASERDGYDRVVLAGRLHDAIVRLNPGLAPAVHDEALRQVLRREHADILPENRRFHKLLVDGLTIPHQESGGPLTYPRVALVDFDSPANNDFLAVNQFTVSRGGQQRRPDVVVFVNGLPLAVFELKDPDASAPTLDGAFQQLRTYQQEIPDLFIYNELLVISQGFKARFGVLTSPFERFSPWRTIHGDQLAAAAVPELEVLIKGVFDPARLLQIVRSFILFEVDGPLVLKKVAAYHQYHAVLKAVEQTVQAAAVGGDRRAGVIWHTQGSGKSLTMIFYIGLLVQHPALQNPTIVALTDRNDLDNQLFANFVHCADLLRQTPEQANSRDELQALLQTAAGGIVFTTIQKFMPERGGAFPLLTDRRNVVVVADEAHRSQYDFIDGYAAHLRDGLPNATFIGFTGTPIEEKDHYTTVVFGDHIDVYDIQRAVEDGATVPIFYESRLARLSLDAAAQPHLDRDFDELTEAEEESDRERLKAKWAALEAIVGAGERVELVARDLVEHFERRAEAIVGKAMIVCMSRRICVDLYDAIARLRPDWATSEDTTGALKVVMTGAAADGPDWQQHIRNKLGREKIAARFKDPDDPLRLVIVRDLWLTGFDIPCLHTMYVDKPMRGHGLMQAIARVNRVFRDKPGGLVVDYIGLADQLQAALATYTQRGGKGSTAIDQQAAVEALEEQYEIVSALFFGFDWSGLLTATGGKKLQLLAAAQEHILAQTDGKKRFLDAFAALKRAFALAAPHARALELRDDVAFFQLVQRALSDSSTGEGRQPGALDQAIRQLVSRAITPEGVVDIFSAAGLQKPDLSILSDAFLAEVQQIPQRNLAVELLQKLLTNEIRTRTAKNAVQSKLFSEKLANALQSYANRTVETAKVIEELIALAVELRAAQARGQQLNLSDSEVAFYDALAAHGNAKEVMGDATLANLARELARRLREHATVDWRLKETARARMRVLVKRILAVNGYPPDQRDDAVAAVIQQAELFADELAA